MTKSEWTKAIERAVANAEGFLEMALNIGEDPSLVKVDVICANIETAVAARDIVAQLPATLHEYFNVVAFTTEAPGKPTCGNRPAPSYLVIVTPMPVDEAKVLS